MKSGWEDEREESTRKTRRRWEDSIKMYLWEIGLEGVDWISLARDRDQWRAVENRVMNLRVS
jgi:hypothetical protein